MERRERGGGDTHPHPHPARPRGGLGGTHLLREPGREYRRCGVARLSPAPRASSSGSAQPEGAAGPGHSSSMGPAAASPPAPRGRLSGRPSARPPAAPRLTQIPPFSTPVPPLRGGSAPLRPRCRRSPPPLPGRGRPAPLACSPPRSPGPQPRGQRCLNPSKSLLSSLVRGGACNGETVAPLYPASSIATAVRNFLD